MKFHIAVHVLPDVTNGSETQVKVNDQIESRYPMPKVEDEALALQKAKARAFDLAYSYGKRDDNQVTLEFINYFDYTGDKELWMTYNSLYSRVYMGHKAFDSAGKPLTWQKLRDLGEQYPNKRLKLKADFSGPNEVYNVVPVPIPAHD